MQTDTDLIFLIDSAKAIAGSDYKLAPMLETTPQRISDWRHGRKPIPAAQLALLASVAGFDPTQTVIRNLVEQHEGTPLGDKLMRVLGKASRATGAVLGFVGVSALVTSSKITETIQCILC